jgi:chromosome segregation ATPase
MTKDTKSGPTGSDAPGPDLRNERDLFLKKFTRGSKLTEEFLREVEMLQLRLRDLESENAALRAKVEADEAIRELLSKIERLETEKRELLSRYHRVEAVNSEFTARVQEVESEFANLANLFVASNQLHSSLSPRGVTRRIKEVLAQLVGAERYCMYLANGENTELVPIARSPR